MYDCGVLSFIDTLQMIPFDSCDIGESLKMTVCSHHSNPIVHLCLCLCVHHVHVHCPSMSDMFISMSYLKSLNPLLFKNKWVFEELSIGLCLCICL